MDMFYKKLSLYLSKNQNISKDDEELYEYAAKVVVHGIINIAITILNWYIFWNVKRMRMFIYSLFHFEKIYRWFTCQ